MDTLKIIDSQSNEYTFDESFGIVSSPFSVRNKSSQRAFSHGAKDVSDGMVDKRIVEVRGQIWGDTISSYNSKMDDFYEALYKQDQKLYKDANRYLNVKKATVITPRLAANNFPRLSNVVIKFFCEDPFWYSVSKTEYNESITETPHEWNVENQGIVEVHPIITITNDGSYASLSLKNKTDDNALFTYDDSNLASGASVVIDCQEGTVLRSTTDTIRYLTGSFLRLLKGVNTLEITGLTNASVEVEFYRRWLTG